jgi:hypothetical protein
MIDKDTARDTPRCHSRRVKLAIAGASRGAVGSNFSLKLELKKAEGQHGTKWLGKWSMHPGPNGISPGYSTPAIYFLPTSP